MFLMIMDIKNGLGKLLNFMVMKEMLEFLYPHGKSPNMINGCLAAKKI